MLRTIFPSKRSSKISFQTSPEVGHQFRRELRQLHSGNRWCSKKYAENTRETHQKYDFHILGVFRGVSEGESHVWYVRGDFSAFRGLSVLTVAGRGVVNPCTGADEKLTLERCLGDNGDQRNCFHMPPHRTLAVLFAHFLDLIWLHGLVRRNHVLAQSALRIF